MKSLAWVDGRIMPLESATMALDDPGFLLGDGVFESLYVGAGKLFRWDLHRQRLANGLATIGIDAAVLDVADQAVTALAEQSRSGNKAAALRLQVSRLPSGAGRVSALLRPLPEYAPRLYQQGARLAIASEQRQLGNPLSAVKSLSFLAASYSRRQALAAGFDDAIIFNSDGAVAEACYANVIARQGDRLFAPANNQGALDGITRLVLLQALPPARYRLQLSLSRAELAAADEVLLTSTYAGVVPVNSIADIANHYAGPKGELTQWMSQCYQQLLADTGTA